MDNSQDDAQSLPMAEVIEPTAQQVEEGVARLNKCLPYWTETPGLLIVKPDLALVVSAVRAEHNEEGFLLHLVVRERLVAPPDFHRTEVKVDCGWNQPYMGFTESEISAPFCFSLYFGAAGVDRARERAKSLLAQGIPEFGFPMGALRAGFR